MRGAKQPPWRQPELRARDSGGRDERATALVDGVTPCAHFCQVDTAHGATDVRGVVLTAAYREHLPRVLDHGEVVRQRRARLGSWLGPQRTTAPRAAAHTAPYARHHELNAAKVDAVVRAPRRHPRLVALVLVEEADLYGAYGTWCIHGSVYTVHGHGPGIGARPAPLCHTAARCSSATSLPPPRSPPAERTG